LAGGAGRTDAAAGSGGLAQRGDRELFAAETERAGARVAGIVEYEHGLLALRLVRAHLGRDLVDGREQARGIGPDEHAQIGVAVATELLEDVGHLARVVFRVAKGLLAGAADVRADQDSVREGVWHRGGGRRKGLGGLLGLRGDRGEQRQGDRDGGDEGGVEAVKEGHSRSCTVNA
jgi:hypothetical protein